MRSRMIQYIILAVILIGVGFVIYQNLANSMSPIREGQAAPEFRLEDLDGNTITLSDYKGKGVLLNFWATYCKPCRAEMPAIQSVYEQYKDQGFAVIGVNTGESPPTILPFVTSEEIGVTFPIALDRELEATKLYQIGPIPASIFIDPEGIIQKIVIGEMKEPFIRQNVLNILPYIVE